MKKQFILAIMAATMMTLGACSNEEVLENTSRKVNFVIGGPITRTTTAENTEGKYITDFVADDPIGIYAAGGAIATNALYKVAADGSSLNSSEEISYTSSDATTFYAYSPYQANQTGNTISFNVKTNQSTEADFNASNFMTTVISGKTSADPNIVLNFKPRLTLVRLEMTGALGKTATAVNVNGKPTVTWTYATTNATGNADIATSGTQTNIPMYHQNANKTSEDPVFAAFLPAQEVTAGTPFFTITIGSSTYNYTPSSAIALSPNTVKRFKISIGADGTTKVLATVTDNVTWIEDGTLVEITGAEVTEQKIELISKDAGDFSKVTLNPSVNGLPSVTSVGWTPVNANNVTIQKEEAENAISILNTNSSSSWYNRALVYVTEPGKGTLGTYTLTFYAKSSAAGELQFAALQAQTSPNTWFKMGTTVGANYMSTTTEYVKKEVIIDLRTKKESGESSTTIEDLAKGILVLFTPKTSDTNVTYYIKDVTLIEKKE